MDITVYCTCKYPLVYFKHINLRRASPNGLVRVPKDSAAVEFNVRLAYRWLDVQTNYNGSLLEKPFAAKLRAFINLAHETQNKWKFDLTTQWLSKKRLPNTSTNPATKQMDSYSPSLIQMSGQVTKQFGIKWDVYIGTENLTGYTQDNLFIGGHQPFSSYFDGSIVWGPVNGRIIYAGLRFEMK